MKPNDDLIQERLRELREEDAVHAPSFHRVLQRPQKAHPQTHWRLVGAAAGIALVIVGAMLWQTHDAALPEPSLAAIEELEAAVESLPTDALLAAVDFDEPARLSREITQMLNR